MNEHANNQTTSESLPLPVTAKTPLFQRLWQRKWIRIGALVTAGIAATATLGWLGWSNSSLSKLGVDTALVEGTVEFRLDSSGLWEKAQEGMSFSEGAQIRTLNNSRAVLNIDDGSAVRLNSNSSVVLTKLAPKHIVIGNTGGDIYTRVVSSNTRTFQVQSDGATYQSLGTAYRTFNTDEKEGVEVYHSKVNILGLRANGNVVVEQGERYYNVNTAATNTEGKVTELSAEELAKDEFVTWNSEQDKQDFKNELGVLFDLTPPTLALTEPANGSITESETVEVKGTVEANAKLTVNGADTANTNGQFAATVSLNEGANSIQVVATDKAGNKTVKTLSITRTVPAAPKPTSSTIFKLSGTKVDGGISFTWSLSGISASKGFKLIKSTTANPTYSSKSDHVYIESSSKRSYTWSIKDGKTYHFRICVYTGEGCSHYSNDITVTAPTKPASEEPSGSLSLSAGSGSNVTWTLNGSAPYGFKLVWSNTAGPTYPGSSAQYYEKTTTSGSITSDPGNYYVRVCMYYEGNCKNYSNEIYVTVP